MIDPAADSAPATDDVVIIGTDTAAMPSEQVSEVPFGDDAPAVVAVVVVDEAVPHLDAVLRSIADQDHRNLSVLVIDAGPDPVTDQVAEILPDAFIHRMSQRPVRSVAANKALDLVSGAPFMLFVDPYTELEPNLTSALIEELYRSNAGLVTPKMVDAADPRRLRKVGMASDRFGAQVDRVEPGEFDQEQYDTVGDVFVAPTGAQLVRTDLFKALGGFDPEMGYEGSDLDLSWRAHMAGARVVAVPRAVARVHRRPVDPDERRRLLGRARLRTILVTGTGLHLALTVPLAIVLLVIEALYSLVAGRRRQARDAIGAITWNLSNFGDIRRRRKALEPVRRVSDREVRALQVGGSARLSGFLRGQFDVGDRVVGFAGSFRDSFRGDDAGVFRDGFLIGVGVALLLLFGSRGLISGGVTPVGRFLDLPSGGVLLSEWLGSWRSIGVGGPGNPPTAFGVLGLLRLVFFWGPGVLDTALVLVPVFAGPIGAWRLVRPLGSMRASALAALAYAANPLMMAAASAARWDALVVMGAGPFLAASALRVQGVAPFGSDDGQPGQGVVERSVPIRLVRFGLLVAAVATFVPAVILIAVAMCAGLVLGGIVLARPTGSIRLVQGAVVAVVAPAALHLPWTVDILQRLSWSWLVGPGSPEARFDSLADLIRFAPGSSEPRLLVVGIVLAALLSLLIGIGARFDTGVRAWSMAVVVWGLIWVDRRGWLGVAIPDAEMLLVPAAVGVALAVGAAARAVEIDLVGFRFGWRQVAAFVGVVAMAGAGLLLVRQSYGGRWDAPEQSFASSVDLLAAEVDGPSRVLWIGDPSVLPVDWLESSAGVTYGVTDGGEPTALSRWMPGTYGLNNQIGEHLDRAIGADTVRVGQLLAPYGIDFVAVVPTLAPAPYVGTISPAPAGVLPALLGQLDLQRVSGVADFALFRNAAARGPVVGLEVDAAEISHAPADLLDTDLTIGQRLDADSAPGEWQWSRPAADDETGSEAVDPASVLVATTADGWSAVTDGVETAPTEGGLLALYPGSADSWELGRPTPWLRWLALLGQAVLVAAGVAVARSEDPR